MVKILQLGARTSERESWVGFFLVACLLAVSVYVQVVLIYRDFTNTIQLASTHHINNIFTFGISVFPNTRERYKSLLMLLHFFFFSSSLNLFSYSILDDDIELDAG